MEGIENVLITQQGMGRVVGISRSMGCVSTSGAGGVVVLVVIDESSSPLCPIFNVIDADADVDVDVDVDVDEYNETNGEV